MATAKLVSQCTLELTASEYAALEIALGSVSIAQWKKMGVEGGHAKVIEGIWHALAHPDKTVTE